MKLWSRIKTATVAVRDTIKEAAVFVATDVSKKADAAGDVIGITGRMIGRDILGDAVATTETNEVIDAALEMITVAKRVGSDGWQFSDVGLVITDQHLMNTIKRALDGAEKIPDELSKLSLSETLGLAMTALSGLQKLGK